MGRKKGRQAGAFESKAQNRAHRLLLKERAHEADAHRNPVRRGYHRDAANVAGPAPQQRGDKWSSIFAKTSAADAGAASSQRATVGLSQLRALLNERQLEDRVVDRQQRVRLYQSRIRDRPPEATAPPARATEGDERHEAGWMLFEGDRPAVEAVPSLQNLAARALGPWLPTYVAACGQEFVREALQSASSHVIAEASAALAASDMTTTDGSVKALAGAGMAEGLALRGGLAATASEEDTDEDARPLTDEGLLSLCPRMQAQQDSMLKSRGLCWETIDFDLAIRRSGCFHLRRLELVDVPLRNPFSADVGGVSLSALRRVLRSCSGLTHLSLAGSFHNHDDVSYRDDENVEHLLCGSRRPSPRAVEAAARRLRKESESALLLRQIAFHAHDEDREDEDVTVVEGILDLRPELRVLDLSRCPWVTPSMILRTMVDEGPEAAPLLNVRGCPGISRALLEEWQCLGNVSDERQRRSQ